VSKGRASHVRWHLARRDLATGISLLLMFAGLVAMLVLYAPPAVSQDSSVELFWHPISTVLLEA